MGRSIRSTSVDLLFELHEHVPHFLLQAHGISQKPFWPKGMQINYAECFLSWPLNATRIFPRSPRWYRTHGAAQAGRSSDSFGETQQRRRDFLPALLFTVPTNNVIKPTSGLNRRNKLNLLKRQTASAVRTGKKWPQLAPPSHGPSPRGVALDNTSRERQKGLQKSPVFKSQSHEEGALTNIVSACSPCISWRVNWGGGPALTSHLLSWALHQHFPTCSTDWLKENLWKSTVRIFNPKWDSEACPLAAWGRRRENENSCLEH